MSKLDQKQVNKASQSVQNDKNSIDIKTPPAIAVRDLRGAKRLLGRIILQLQKGEIEESKSKTLAYLLTVFIEICSASDFEKRIQKLEKEAGE